MHQQSDIQTSLIRKICRMRRLKKSMLVVLGGFVVSGFLLFGPANVSTTRMRFARSRMVMNTSTCSDRATKIGGLKQKVVSFSLYNHQKKSAAKIAARKRYEFGIVSNYEAIQKYYPGWSMRVYTDLRLDEMDKTSPALNRILHSDSFFICNTTKLPRLGNVSNLNGMIWRFLPIGDPTVDTFLVRDLDSKVGLRESLAVAEWAKSNKSFHGMRDHKKHWNAVMGGLWGCKNTLLDQTTRLNLETEFIKLGAKGHGYGYDQNLLRDVLYLKFPGQFMSHDAYHCGHFKDSVPFPKQRKNRDDFVGNYQHSNKSKAAECPKKCRPSYGKKWTYC